MRPIPIPRLVFALFFISISTVISISQTPTPTPKISEEDTIVKVDSRLVVVPVSVTDMDGQPVLGLKAADFKIVEEGKPQTVDSVADANAVPLEIVLLFDISASTDAMFRFEQETAGKFLKDVLRPDDRAAIFSIGQKPLMIQGRDTAERSTQGVLSIAPTKGATAFYDTVTMAADYLRKNSPEGRRRVMLVISDGEDNFSEGVQNAQRRAERKVVDNSPDPDLKRLGAQIKQAQEDAKMSERLKVIKSLQDGDIVFFSINPAGSSYKLNEISIFGQGNMQAFAEQTGGTAFLPKFAPVDTPDALRNTSNARKNQTALDLIFRQLANELRAQYLVQYYPETEYATGRFVKLAVSLTNPAGRKIRAREGYFVKP